jgi:hypothetical protein
MLVLIRLMINERDTFWEVEEALFFIVLPLWFIKSQGFAFMITWLILFPLLNFHDFNLYVELLAEQQILSICRYARNQIKYQQSFTTSSQEKDMITLSPPPISKSLNFQELKLKMRENYFLYPRKIYWVSESHLSDSSSCHHSCS